MSNQKKNAIRFYLASNECADRSLNTCDENAGLLSGTS